MLQISTTQSPNAIRRVFALQSRQLKQAVNHHWTRGECQVGARLVDVTDRVQRNNSGIASSHPQNAWVIKLVSGVCPMWLTDYI